MATPGPEIIAVGGAKGGIGKSILASNLGVLLSNAGRHCILIDMDLGGANLHLYLGEMAPGPGINDFLTKKVPTLAAAMRKTKFGPDLIVGDSTQFGIANLHFARKLKLLKAIRNLEADYVILDLGGDTAYNVLDFFLAADHQLVLTTCEPAAYLNAYSLIKMALYRKMLRIFGPESPYRNRKDSDLSAIIQEFIDSKNGSSAKPVKALIEQVKTQQPENLATLQMLIESFAPHIILGMTDEQSMQEKVVRRIQEVSQKMLGIQVGYLGCIPYLPEIKNSVQELVPVVAKDPQGAFAKCIHAMMIKGGLQLN